jgi:hypothetical protein
MMNQVKHFLAFVLGAGYLGCFWWLDWLNRIHPLTEENLAGPQIFPMILIIFGTLFLVGSVFCFFLENWDQK